MHDGEDKKTFSNLRIYQFLKLVLILHVIITIVERCFSAMKIVKISHDQFLNDCIVCFLLKNELFEKITNEIIVKKNQNIEFRRINL